MDFRFDFVHRQLGFYPRRPFHRTLIKTWNRRHSFVYNHLCHGAKRCERVYRSGEKKLVINIYRSVTETGRTSGHLTTSSFLVYPSINIYGVLTSLFAFSDECQLSSEHVRATSFTPIVAISSWAFDNIIYSIWSIHPCLWSILTLWSANFSFRDFWWMSIYICLTSAHVHDVKPHLSLSSGNIQFSGPFCM